MMSSSYSSRPRTPPGPPPSSSSHRKSSSKSSSSGGGSRGTGASGSGRNSSSSGSKMPPPHSGDIYTYASAPEKLHKSSYPLGSSKSSASYASDKYNKSNSVRKSSGKVPSSDKYNVSKSDPYLEDYKPRIINNTSHVSDHYLEKEVYATSRYPPESKGIRSYPEKVRSVSDQYNDGNYNSVSNKNFYDSYDSYGGKTSHYPKLESDPYYSGGSSSGYGAYGAYAEPVGAAGSYGGDKLGGGGRLRAAYPEDERRNYRDFSPQPIRSARSPLNNRSGTRYNDYGHYSPPPQTSDRLRRYVIGDSVVYGDKEYYPNLRPPSPRGRPPSPPPQPLARSYSRYSDNSPRRGYSSISGRSPLSGVPRTPPYRSPSPLNRRPPSPARRPPSPPSRRPPSPDSSYMRAPRSSQEASYERSRVKDSYKNSSKNRVPSSSPRTPPREPVHTDRHRSDGKSPKDKERKRELDKRSRDRDRNNKHIRNNSAGYRNNSITRKKDSQVAISQSKERVESRDDKRARPPIIRNGREETSRDRKDNTSREKDRTRRIEDRLGPTPNSVGNHRRSPVRGRVARRPNSPSRDKKRGSIVNRRPDDLRLWIESRKNDGGNKRPLSPNRSRLPASKRLGRAGDRNPQLGNKRSRIDPKKRLGNKGRRKGININNARRNKILKKYGRLNAAKRGGKGGGGGGGGGGDGGGGGNAKNKNYKDDGYKGKNGSSGSNRRVVSKPATKHISKVNLLPLKPRILKKPTSKLLQDSKENEKRKSEDRQNSQTTKELSSLKEEKPSNASTDVATSNSK